MTQAVRDGATVPVYYESRVVSLKLDADTLKQIDDEYDLLAEEGATPEQIAESKHRLSNLEAILGAPETIDSLVDDILNHYENNRQYELSGKAMIVAYSRPIAIDIYKNILKKRPDWTDKVKCVMTSSNNDPEEWHEIIGNKQYSFSDNASLLGAPRGFNITVTDMKIDAGAGRHNTHDIGRISRRPLHSRGR